MAINKHKHLIIGSVITALVFCLLGAVPSQTDFNSLYFTTNALPMSLAGNLTNWAKLPTNTFGSGTGDVIAGNALTNLQPVLGAGTKNVASTNVPGFKAVLLLENVDNTSDAGKPVSVAQQAALDLKQNLSANLTAWSALATSAKQDASANLSSWSSINPAAKQDAFGAIYQATNSNLTLWATVAPSTKQDSSANLTSWSAIAPAAKQDASANLAAWSLLATSAKQDAFGAIYQATNSNLTLWATVPETSAGVQGVLGQVYQATNVNLSAWSALATSSKANAATTLAGYGITDAVHLSGDTMTGTLTVTGLTNSALTASRAVVSAADKSLASSATTSTELGYVSGVTSAIQTQINAKLASSAISGSGALYAVSGTPTTAALTAGRAVVATTANVPVSSTVGASWPMSIKPTSLPSNAFAKQDAGRSAFRLLFLQNDLAYWQMKLPRNYNGNLQFDIDASMNAAVSGTLTWSVRVWKTTPGAAVDRYTANYGTADTASVTIPGTAGFMVTATVTCANASAVVAGDDVNIELKRTDATVDSVGAELTGWTINYDVK